MALQINITLNGVTYTNAYVTAGVRNRKKKNKQMVVMVCFYANQSYSNSNPEDPFYTMILNASEADFDQFFSVATLSELNNNIEKACYDFLKTIDPEEEDSVYSNCPVDFKNDSTDI